MFENPYAATVVAYAKNKLLEKIEMLDQPDDENLKISYIEDYIEPNGRYFHMNIAPYHTFLISHVNWRNIVDEAITWKIQDLFQIQRVLLIDRGLIISRILAYYEDASEHPGYKNFHFYITISPNVL